MFDQSPSFMAVIRLPGQVIELANDSFAEMVGRRDLIGRRLSDVLPEIDEWATAELVEAVSTTRRPYRAGGVRIAGVRERFVDLVCQPIADRGGAIGAVFLDGSDVTDRVRAEERLLLSTESLRLATEAAEVGIWDLDLATDTLTWSERTKAMFGIPPSVPVSMEDFRAGLHPDDADATGEAFAAALDPVRRANYDVEYRRGGRGGPLDSGAGSGLVRRAWDVPARGRNHHRRDRAPAFRGHLAGVGGALPHARRHRSRADVDDRPGR
jgi:PAS domain S-box-containing protein